MVKKLQKLADKKAASPAGLLDSQLAQTVKDSAQQIWLAGLGAFAKAQGEGGKLFETLMKEGVSLQRKTQAAAEEKLGGVAGKMTAMAGEVGHKANAQWDKLETIFEERTARALGKLGVPTAKELTALAERVDALGAALAKQGGAPATARFKAGKALRDPLNAAAPHPPAARKAARKVAAEPKAGTIRRRVSAKPAEAAPVAAAAPAPGLSRRSKGDR